MREWIELRVSDPEVLKRLPPDLGRDLDSAQERAMWKRLDPGYVGGVRRIDLPRDSPKWDLIFGILRDVFGDPYPHYSAWAHRRCTKKELLGAGLLRLQITKVFEPPGELCGTVYDESAACDLCGVGRRQVSDLHLQLRRVQQSWPSIPQAKRAGMARTIADEIIVSAPLAELMERSGITGATLLPVRGRGRDAKITPLWRQLQVRGTAGPTHAPTEFGIDPFKSDHKGQYRCPYGHVSGLALLSEVHVERESWDGSDMTATTDLVGRRAGVLVPSPMLLISQRMHRLLQEHKVKGFKVEVAHLV